MYNLSEDYEKLFDIICDGNVAAGFVDYRFNDDDKETPAFRDVCQIRRDGDWKISVHARGIVYGSVYPFDQEYGRTEKELFIKMCQSMSLGWIQAGV
jgi:hypothetical protein